MSTHNIRPVKTSRLAVAGLGLALCAGAVVYTGIDGRAHSEAELARWDAAQAVPTVEVVHPVPGSSHDALVLPGTIQAFNTASIYPRATGYVKAWMVDIGAHVTAGQTLATIESPDLDQQLQQARADLVSAQANATLAAATAGRWNTLVKSDVVSQQAADEKSFDSSAKAAAVMAAKANVARLEDLASFDTLKAPFDGVVTARNVDIGNLVGGGGSTSKPLFEIADLHRIRAYVRVPQAFLGGLKPGLSATLDLPQYPDHPFGATLVSTAHAVSEESRTALVEFQADNTGGKLWPGTFAEVHIDVPAEAGVLQLPATALVFGRKGMRVAVVDAKDRIVMTPVTLGRNLGTQVEVRGGLSAQDRVVDHPLETVGTGQLVQVAAAQAAPPQGAAAADAPK